MEEREQPTMEQADVLNKTNEQGAVSEVGSQTAELGKFKNAQALLEAYNNLQSEFTKKCQLLSQFEKDKTASMQSAQEEESIPQENAEEDLNQFLEQNDDAKGFVEEIKSNYDKSISSPYQVAWAKVVLDHITNGQDKSSDPIINQYVLSDEKLKNKIVEDYLERLRQSAPPIVMSSSNGQRLSSVLSDSPTTLEEAKNLTRKMFE